MIPVDLLEDTRTTSQVLEAKLVDERGGSSISPHKATYPKIKVMPISGTSTGGEFECEFGSNFRVVSITETQKNLLASWSTLLQELERRLLASSDADLRKFALFETFSPFKGNDLMMLVADTVLARAKQIVLNETPVENRCKFADAIKGVNVLFQKGTNEEQLMLWLDNLARKQI